jgi:hypothetical protein
VFKVKKILDICKKPDINTYSYHAYLNAILQSDRKNGNELLNINISKFQDFKWDFCSQNNCMKVEDDNLEISFIREGYNEPNEGFLLRKCQREDSIVVKINRYLPCSLNTIINVICGERQGGAFDQNSVRFGLMGNKKFYIISNCQEIKPKIICIKEFPCWLKATRINERLSMYYSIDGVNWSEVCEVNGINWKDKNNYIGINYNMFDNDYENWKYSNYFQIFLDENNSVKVDYYNISKRNYGYHYLNQFLIFNYKNIDNMSKDEFVESIINLIYEDKYLSMHLDEFYFEKTDKVIKRHYIHSNLVFGVDREKEIFQVLGYNDDGKLCERYISFNGLYKAHMAVKKKEYKKIEVIEYNPSRNKYKFEIKYFLLQIEEFLKGINSSIRLAGVLPVIEGKYGVEVYQYIEKHPDILIEDLRITYLFVERNRLMKERIKFLHDRCYLKYQEWNELFRGFSSIGDMLNKLLYICMLGNFRGHISLQMVSDEVRKIKEKEIQECTKLLKILKKYERRTK